MLNFLIFGAVIALGVVIYNAWTGDEGSQSEQNQKLKDGEKGCGWLIFFIAAIILVAILTAIAN
ncbi:MAG: hypothetical protein KUL85_16480 [Sphingobacterium mizutaii]|nr:hypothetical protein [Sphingobacterium mizutaii]